MSLNDIGKFSDPSLLILTSLAEGPKHGYAMIEDIQKLSNIKLGPGTLYGAIARLEERGLIESLLSEDRRKPYRLTGAGIHVLQEQLKSLESFTMQGLRRLGVQA